MSTTTFSKSDIKKTAIELAVQVDRCLDADDSVELKRLCGKTHDFAIEARRYYRQSEAVDNAEELRDELRAQGYKFERQGGTVWITIPLLLPKSGGDVDFIIKPLSELLNLELVRERFTECTIVYQQVYNRRRQNAASRMRDSDNLEIRCVQNVIERYLLTSDSANLCATVHLSRPGECDETCIAIFPGKLSIADIREVLAILSYITVHLHALY